MTGKLTSWNHGGFGFIRVSGRKREVFVHASQFQPEIPRGETVPVGAEIMFDVERDPRRGRDQAVNAILVQEESAAGLIASAAR